MMLTEVRLPCGCLTLCDRDGPVCCLEPCPTYPDASAHIQASAANWRESLCRSRLLEKARQKRRYARRKALEG